MNDKIKRIIAGIALLPYFGFYLPIKNEIKQEPSRLESLVETSIELSEPSYYSTLHEVGNYSSGHYSAVACDYMQQFVDSKEDMSQRVPLKWLNVHAISQMPGLLGFTYLGDNSVNLREGLIKDKKMVDIHESIHTPDEYETRVLTDWIMEKPNINYKK